jgi:hypothetical protein
MKTTNQTQREATMADQKTLNTAAKSYYLAPATWNQSGYREVYAQDEINDLPDDWNANESDCEYLGDFDNVEEADAAARIDNNSEMKPQN